MEFNVIIELLYSERKEQGKTIKKVAEALGVTAGAVAHWEHFRRRPQIDQLYRWANYLGLDIEINLVPIK